MSFPYVERISIRVEDVNHYKTTTSVSVVFVGLNLHTLVFVRTREINGELDCYRGGGLLFYLFLYKRIPLCLMVSHIKI